MHSSLAVVQEEDRRQVAIIIQRRLYIYKCVRDGSRISEFSLWIVCLNQLILICGDDDGSVLLCHYGAAGSNSIIIRVDSTLMQEVNRVWLLIKYQSSKQHKLEDMQGSVIRGLYPHETQ